MPSSWRRGETEVNLIYDAIFSLVILGLFAAGVFVYIENNATGAQYFSKFYATDLATSAQLANAAYGDVSLRYDNLKPELNLAFWFENGRVAVAKPPDSTTSVSAGASGIGLVKGTPAPGGGEVDVASPALPTVTTVWGLPATARQTYGKAQDYPQPAALLNPRFLALRKVGRSFSITPAEVVLDECPSGQPLIPIKDVLVYAQVDGVSGIEADKAIGALRDALDQAKISWTRTEANATVVLRLTHRTGQIDEITAKPTSQEGVRYACLFNGWLSFLSLSHFSGADAPRSGSRFEVDLTVTTDTQTQLRPEHLGQALAYALTRLYADSAQAGAPASSPPSGAAK